MNYLTCRLASKKDKRPTIDGPELYKAVPEFENAPQYTVLEMGVKTDFVERLSYWYKNRKGTDNIYGGSSLRFTCKYGKPRVDKWDVKVMGPLPTIGKKVTLCATRFRILSADEVQKLRQDLRARADRDKAVFHAVKKYARKKGLVKVVKVALVK